MAKFSKELLESKLERIAELQKKREEIESELRKLVGLEEDATEPLPPDFDYKFEILNLFKATPLKSMNVAQVCQELKKKHAFEPDQKSVANRVTYLLTRTQDIQKVEGKRGVYQLRPRVYVKVPEIQVP